MIIGDLWEFIQFRLIGPKIVNHKSIISLIYLCQRHIVKGRVTKCLSTRIAEGSYGKKNPSLFIECGYVTVFVMCLILHETKPGCRHLQAPVGGQNSAYAVQELSYAYPSFLFNSNIFYDYEKPKMTSIMIIFQ